MSIPNSLPQTLADREIDALVAEKVMGWSRISEDPSVFWDGKQARYFDDLKERQQRLGFQPHEHWGYWSPSTDISAAFQVVEKIQHDQPGWRFSLVGGDQSYPMVSRGAGKIEVIRDGTMVLFGWRAEFFGHVDPAEDCGTRHGSAHGDAIPMAICLAALQALHVEVSSHD